MHSLFFQLFGQICIVSSDTTDCSSPRLCLEIHEKKYFTARLHSLPGAMRCTQKVFRQLSTAEHICIPQRGSQSEGSSSNRTEVVGGSVHLIQQYELWDSRGLLVFSF